MLILDNGSIHKSKRVQEFINKHNWVEQLQSLVKELCQEKIASFKEKA
jgi:hypothetical protein